eukprot:5443611-Alexandrium_andersonii.AAC.1
MCGFGICADNAAGHTPRELRTLISRPVLGPRSSSSERLKRSCVLHMAECELRRVAVLMSLEWTADCT